MPKAKILVVEDEKIVALDINNVLNKLGYDVPALVASGEEAIQEVKRTKPDLVLMDIFLKGAKDGIEALTTLRSHTVDLILADIGMPRMNGYQLYDHVAENPQWVMIPFVFLTARALDSDIRYAKELGVDDYLTKPFMPDDLLAAIRVVAAGEVFLHPIVASALVQDYLRRVRSGTERESYDGLTIRQREVLTLIAEGLSNQDIASRLGISIRTVERHRENIMERLNLHSRTDLVKYALRKGLIQLE